MCDIGHAQWVLHIIIAIRVSVRKKLRAKDSYGRKEN